MLQVTVLRVHVLQARDAAVPADILINWSNPSSSGNSSEPNSKPAALQAFASKWQHEGDLHVDDFFFYLQCSDKRPHYSFPHPADYITSSLKDQEVPPDHRLLRLEVLGKLYNEEWCIDSRSVLSTTGWKA